MKATRRHTGQRGFTVIELLIATAVFSVVLLICMSSLIQIGRMYYKGIIETRTQEAARNATEQITQAVQFASANYVPLTDAGDGSRGFCIGDKRYSYLLNRQLVDSAPSGDQSLRVLVVDDLPSCGATPLTAQALTSGSVAGTELLGVRMRVTQFTVAPLGAGQGFYEVRIRIVYGDQDLLVPYDTNGDGTNDDVTCAGSTGTQFCAVSELSSVVQKRVI